LAEPDGFVLYTDFYTVSYDLLGENEKLGGTITNLQGFWGMVALDKPYFSIEDTQVVK
jgi:hypothetical protein